MQDNTLECRQKILYDCLEWSSEHDIDLEDILEVNSPITCIHQFQSSDNLLITTLDGNVYLYKLDLNYILSVNTENDIEITI